MASSNTFSRPLRLITSGSVDDGKSTLIGRLLYDSQALMRDQVAALEAEAQRRGADEEALDLSRLTDGLSAEREQGITIDVAYRYFATPQRKYIIADAPGHEQYTRNMVTGASRCDVAIVLIDPTKLDFSAERLQLLPQTRRHASLVGLLGLRRLVLAVNKIDALPEAEQAFRRVCSAFAELAQALSLPPWTAIPISALLGDNVVRPGTHTPWYEGPSLLEHLDGLSWEEATAAGLPSLAVQYVSRDAADGHRRWLLGELADGPLQAGDAVLIAPSGLRARILALRDAKGDCTRLEPGQAAAILLDRAVDVGRGDWVLLDRAQAVEAPRQVKADLAWLDTQAWVPGQRLLVRHGTRWLAAYINRIEARLDLQAASWRTCEPDSPVTVESNDIVRAELELAEGLPLASYRESKARGAMLLVDPLQNRTLAAAMLHEEPVGVEQA